MLNNLEKQTSVPKVYAFLGLVGIYFFLIFFNIAGEFLVNVAGFIIPGYYSLNALFSAGKTDDTQVSSPPGGQVSKNHNSPFLSCYRVCNILADLDCSG